MDRYSIQSLDDTLEDLNVKPELNIWLQTSPFLISLHLYYIYIGMHRLIVRIPDVKYSLFFWDAV